jgi:hypothetical protein
MESNFLLNDFDIVLNKQKNNRVINEEEIKNENLKDNIIKICYNKKWLILLGLSILLIFMYIYYYNISITIPSINLNNFKFHKTVNTNKTCDDITDFDDSNIKWDIETEIMNYIKLQDEYIASKNT